MKKVIRITTYIFIIISFQANVFAQGGIWTWMHGADTAGNLGNYGTIGIASINNEPPARYEPNYWNDKQGNFWMFGGLGDGVEYNDLWKFNVASNMWTCINAGGPANYGTQGIPSINNWPPAKCWGATCWTDTSGDFWLYGGVGISTGSSNSLWKYHVATNQWTWVHGSNALFIQPMVYGALGVADPLNTPGTKAECKSAWTDTQNNLWMFGGQSTDTADINFNDLWKYSISTNEWALMKCDFIPYSSGNFGALGVETSSNIPPGNMSFTNWGSDDYFYLFGGANGYTSSTGILNHYNCVWKYNIATNNWTWESGTNMSSDPGVYNIQCNPSITEYPANHFENQTVTYQNCQKSICWNFGGVVFNATPSTSLSNDLWMYNLDNKKWTWVSGGNPALPSVSAFGTLGVPSNTNMIPPRAGGAIWSDSLNNLWVFGGFTNWGIFGVSSYRRNDLWRFTPDTSCLHISNTFNVQLVPPSDTLLCIGEKTTMNGIPNSATVSYTPAATVTPNADTTSLEFAPLVTTTYTIIAIDSSAICPGIDTLIFTIYISPLSPISISPPIDTLLCAGEKTYMNGIPNTFTISFNPSTGVLPNADTTSLEFSPSTTTTYTIYALDTAYPCAEKDTLVFTIQVENPSGISLIPPAITKLCAGEQTSMYNIPSAAVISYFPTQGVSANSDTTELVFYPSSTTTYTVIALDPSLNCIFSDTIIFNIEVFQIPYAAFIVNPLIASKDNPTFTLTNISNNATQFQWYANGNLFSTQYAPTFFAADTGEYCFELVAFNNLNCSDTASHCAKVLNEGSIFVPNAFSPNGDEHNNVLKILGKDIILLSFAVYNRWGQQVFATDNIAIGWNGTYKGKPCDVGTYYYMIEYDSFGKVHTLKGDIALLR